MCARRSPSTSTTLTPFRSRATFLCAAVAVAALAVACSSGDGEGGDDAEAFVLRSTGHAAAQADEELISDGNLLAYRVSEAGQGATGTDFNGDGDFNDSIAVRYNTATRSATVLNVATLELAFARQTLFLSVSEAADGVDWNRDMDLDDIVLLYVTSSGGPVFLDEMPATSTGRFAAIGSSVVYPSSIAPTQAMMTNLRVARVAATGAIPSTPLMVLTGIDPNNDGISYDIVGSDGDIVFLQADETLDGELNGDGDAVDTAIFAVLDVGVASPEAFLAARAWEPASTPTAVPVSGAGEWLIAFLVDETAENATLNDPADFSAAWRPSACSTTDNDVDDSVLFWFQLTDLAMGTPAVNTGLVGESDGIAYALRSKFVGVVSPESDQGPGAGCILNGDGDREDDVFRWVAAANPLAPPLPVTSASRLLAVDTSIPGGSGGVIRLFDAWVIAVDELADGRDHDGQAGTDRVLAGMHNPSVGSQSWNFMHGSSSPRPIAFSWMSEDRESVLRFYAAVTEESLSLGAGTDFNGDGDDLDSFPTIPAVFSGNRLTFPGIQVATSRSNAGLIVKENIGVHRMSEADQGNTDFNNDGDTNDFILQRFSLVGAFGTTSMTTSDSVSTPSVSVGKGNAAFAGFLTEEFQVGSDLNGDGDTNDSVVRFFRLPRD